MHGEWLIIVVGKDFYFSFPPNTLQIRLWAPSACEQVQSRVWACFSEIEICLWVCWRLSLLLWPRREKCDVINNTAVKVLLCTLLQLWLQKLFFFLLIFEVLILWNVLTLSVYFLFSVSCLPSDIVLTLFRALFVWMHVSLCMCVNVPVTFTGKKEKSLGQSWLPSKTRDSWMASAKENDC